MELSNYKIEPDDNSSFVGNQTKLEISSGDKCGEIFRNKSVFTYQCGFCIENFTTIVNFHLHIFENHNFEEEKISVDGDFETTPTDNNYDIPNSPDHNDSSSESEIKISKKKLHLSKLEKTKKKVVNISARELRISTRNKNISKIKNENKSLKFNTENKKSEKIEDENNKKKIINKIVLKTKKRSIDRIQWQLEKIFPNETEAVEYILAEKVWSFLHKNFTKKGMKRYYRCNRVKFRGQQCASSILYFENNRTGKCEVYRSNSEHTCDKIGASQSSSRLTPDIKIEIEKLYHTGIKLKDIVTKIEKQYNSKSGQVKHFLKLLKIKREKSVKVEIEEWLKLNDNIPESLTEPFVVSYESNEDSLRFLVSSKLLLANAINVYNINVNGIKKLTWRTYTIYILGTTDSASQFKSFGIAICQSDEIEDFIFIFKSLVKVLKEQLNEDFTPQILFRDSNHNVETAFYNIFSNTNAKAKICWNHVRNKLRIKLEYLLPEHHNKKEEILTDLDAIQKCQNLELFQISVNEFANKWALYVEFITYFHQEWIDKNQNWYDGIEQTTISNNNPIEVIIKKIQNDETFRERLPFEFFKEKFLEWIKNLSGSESNIKNTQKCSDFEVKLETTTSQCSITSTDASTSNITSPIKNNLLYTNFKSKSIPFKSKGPKTSYKTTMTPKTSILKVPQSERKKRAEKMWKEEMTFKNLAEAEIAVESEKIWSLSTKNRTKAGTKIYFRCNKVPFRGVQCDACIYLFLKSDCTKVILVRSGLAHNCHEIAFKNRGIDKEIRSEIERLNDLNWKPQQILEFIQDKNFDSTPSKIQISNYLAVLRERKYGASNIDSQELILWLKENTEIPESETKMFIVSHELNNNQYQFFFSSKRLLENSVNIQSIHADGFHKIEWVKFPIYFISTTDVRGKYYSLGIAVCFSDKTENFEFIFNSLKEGVLRIYNNIINPKVLITDNNINIQLAFKNVFGKIAKVKICWHLVSKSIKKKLDEMFYSKDVTTGIIKDVDILHRSSTSDEFHTRLTLFLTRWSEYEEFINYFQQEWISSNENWYQGYDTTSSMTNTALETFVKAMKNDQLFRKKISLSNFSIILKKCIETWSLESENFYVGENF